MSTKIYTAQEMRDTLKCMYENMIVGMREPSCTVNSNDVIAMLRYAADVVGRCEEARLDFHSCPDERDIINYILRGDAGKEDK